MATGTIKKVFSGLKYDGDHGSTTATWTAPYSGFAVASVIWDTSRTQAYWYITDTTSNVRVAALYTKDADGSGFTVSFPIISGHVYDGKSVVAHVNQAHLYCYQFI